ncbi:MAG: SBBP repeat-containing protein [Candidatus Binataceae bacterium]
MRNIAIAAAASIAGFVGFVAVVFAAASLTVSPNSLTFDGVALGTTSAPRTVAIKNRGGAAIHIAGLALSNGFNAIDDKCTGANLARNANCTVGVTFTASRSETIEGELAIETETTSPLTPLPFGEGNRKENFASRSPFPEGEGSQGVRSNNRRTRHRRNQAVVQLTGVPGPAASGIFVANPYANSATVYPIDAVGDAPPSATISGSATLLGSPFGIAAGPGGEIYVANYGANGLTVYAANSSGNVSPTTQIGGALTGLASPEGIAVDSSGNLYVANNAPGFGSITVFGAGQSGDVPPSQTIAGASTGLAYPSGVALDSSGNLYAANLEGGTNGAGSITVYSNSANGNAPPHRDDYRPGHSVGTAVGDRDRFKRADLRGEQ